MPYTSLETLLPSLGLPEVNLTTRTIDLTTIHYRKRPFLKRLITGDEKWIPHNSVACRKSLVPRVTLDIDKTLIMTQRRLCFPNGGIFFQAITISYNYWFNAMLLTINETFNCQTKYNTQNRQIGWKTRPRPQTSFVNCNNLGLDGWYLLARPTYSPSPGDDLPPKLLWIYSNSRTNRTQKPLTSVIDSKSQTIYDGWIMQLVERWEQVTLYYSQYWVH